MRYERPRIVDTAAIPDSRAVIERDGVVLQNVYLFDQEFMSSYFPFPDCLYFGIPDSPWVN